MSYEKDEVNVPEESNLPPVDPPDQENPQPLEPIDPPDNSGGNTVLSDI